MTSTREKDRALQDEFARRLNTDVSVRLEGNAQSALGLLPQALQLLKRATLFRDAGQPVVKMWSKLSDGSFMYVFLHGPVKHLYVHPAPLRPEVVVSEPEEIQKLISIACPDMLSGVVYPGAALLLPKVFVNDPDVYTVHEFHPTSASANVYELSFTWQDAQRLAVAGDPDIGSAMPQVRWPKPSMYSGAMKRIVQGLYGIGSTTTLSGGNEPRKVSYDAQNHYDYRWASTDGIHKVGSVYWLIRISKVNGVLAMPLPLFECTTNDRFLETLAEIGDVDTYAIVNEFGGLPTGEGWPSSVIDGSEPISALESAISTQRVLRLLSVDDLAPFYVDASSGVNKSGYFDACGWAFSNTGLEKEAHNTCWWYSRPDISQATWWEGGWYFDGNMNAKPEDRFMRAEHWKITLDITNESPGIPYSGKAALELVEMQPLEAPNTWGINTFGFNTKQSHTKGWDATSESYIEGDHEYYPFGAYGGTTALGYGISDGWSRTRFFSSQGGPYTDRVGAGSESCLPWRSDIYTDVGDGHIDEFHAITGPGMLSSPAAPRLAHCCVFYGFNPKLYRAELKTLFSHVLGENVALSHAPFWTHRALMLVPQNSRTSTLSRFEFWGRSQCSVPIDEMEPAYAAPVHVFYVGETLEIVRRQAERWKDNVYTMGDFWGTSLDMRINSAYTTTTDSYNMRRIDSAPNPEGHIGLIIPQGVREGYVLLRSVVSGDTQVGSPEYPLTEATETWAVGVYAVNGESPKIAEYTNYAWDKSMPLSPGYYGDAGTTGLQYEVVQRWDIYWTSVYYNAVIKFAVSINAQTGESVYAYEHNGPMRDWNPFDIWIDPLFSPEFVTSPPAEERSGYPRYNFIFPQDIVLPAPPTPWGIDPIDITFVGGV